MDPMQIKIADVIARSSDAPVVIKKRLKSKVKGVQPKIAYVFEGNIYVEDLHRMYLKIFIYKFECVNRFILE